MEASQKPAPRLLPQRTIWAVADQCSVSAGNFLTNLVLLRVLLPVEFGTYALLLNGIIFFSTVQQALVTYPLCVRGARATPRQFQRLVGFALLGTGLLVACILAPTLSIAGIFLKRPTVIWAAVLAMFFWQLQDTIRAAFIARMEQRRALLGDALSYLGQALFLGCVSLRLRPSLPLVFATVAVTSLVALLIQSWQLRPAIPPRRSLKPIVGEFWFLGRWTVVAKILGFLTLQAFPWLILLRHGRLQVAGFQAIFQLLAFTNPLLFSLGSLITATVAKQRDFRTPAVLRYILLATGLVGSYLLVLAVAGRPIMRLLYGSHSPYLAFASLIRIFALAWIFEIVAQLATAILGGLREPRSLFHLQVVGAFAAVLVALPLSYVYGVFTAGFGLLLINVLRASTGVLLLWRYKPNLPGGRTTSPASPLVEATAG